VILSIALRLHPPTFRQVLLFVPPRGSLQICGPSSCRLFFNELHFQSFSLARFIFFFCCLFSGLLWAVCDFAGSFALRVFNFVRPFWNGRGFPGNFHQVHSKSNGVPLSWGQKKKRRKEGAQQPLKAI